MSLAIFAISAPAHAVWREASSEHFVIYADDSERDLQRFAEMLESYHSAMERVIGKEVETPTPSARVTIFVVGSGRDIRELVGGDNRRVAGFYIPRASGSKAFVQDIKITRGYPDFSVIILLHEYAHHFLMYSSRYQLPKWANEGRAEFFSAATFASDGGVSLGRPALHRANELQYGDRVSVEELFDPELYERKRSRRHDAFYGRSWMLYHYLTFNEDRRGQLTKYLLAVANGQNSIEAAREVFGDLDVLESELRRYSRQRRMSGITIKPENLDVGEISIRTLPVGEAEMMPLRIQSQRGVDTEKAAEIIIEARQIAAKYPHDAGVQTALAEAEYDSGNDDLAIAAADRAIAADPSRKNAYVQKGYALFRKAGDTEDAEDEEAAYAAAMKPFQTLNQLEQDHPLPLMYYFRSFTERGLEPSENAKHALERAQQIVPFDQNLQMQVGMMLAQEGKIALAQRFIHAVANNPHPSSRQKFAKTMLGLLEKAEEGKPFRSREVALSEVLDTDDKGEDPRQPK